MENSKKQNIIFMHIPKTAGSTLILILNEIYENIDQRSFVDERARIINLLKNEKPECISAHLPFGLHKYSSNECVYITMLRNPVDRVLSYYYWIQEHSITSPAKNMTLEEYLNSNYYYRIVNQQTQFASGAFDPNEADLEKAKENLQNHFAAVGITERFDESILLFKNVLHWKYVPAYTRINVTNKPEFTPDHLIKKIMVDNKLDVELYEWALIHFEKALRFFQ